MSKFVWAISAVAALALAGCAEDVNSVPDGAKAGWTEATVGSFMTSCKKRTDALERIMDVEKVCRCEVKQLAPLMTYQQFMTNRGPVGTWAQVSRECKRRHRI